MNIRDLEYLIALAEHKHFRRAAEACNVSQPTLSGQIRKLEDELGTILLERTSRKVLFTQAGLTLVDQAKVVLREVKVLREMASNQGKEMSGPLHVGIIPTLAPYYELRSSQVIDQLESGQLDCAILALMKETEPFIEVRLFNEEMCLAVSDKHAWAKQQHVPLSDLREKELLFLDEGNCLRTQTLDYCLSMGAKESEHFKATNLETLRNMVAADVGISLIPKLATKPTEGVNYLTFDEPQPYRAIGLIYRPGSPLRLRYERLARAVSEIMRNEIEAKHE